MDPYGTASSHAGRRLAVAARPAYVCSIESYTTWLSPMQSYADLTMCICKWAAAGLRTCGRPVARLPSCSTAFADLLTCFANRCCCALLGCQWPLPKDHTYSMRVLHWLSHHEYPPSPSCCQQLDAALVTGTKPNLHGWVPCRSGQDPKPQTGQTGFRSHDHPPTAGNTAVTLNYHCDGQAPHGMCAMFVWV